MDEATDTRAFTGQGADNKPHLMYFHHETRIGFVWDGIRTTIEVNQGGVGEPGMLELVAPLMLEGILPGIQSLRRSLELFQQTCDTYVASIMRGLEMVPQTEDKYRPGEFYWNDHEVQKEMRAL